jgi:hypothetical protein
MELERIACGSCGAALDVPEVVQYITCRHCGSALHVQRTDSVAFTEVLQTLQEQSARIAENTDVLRLQNEITLLDQDWERRSADLMIHGKEGRISTPDKTSAVIGGVFITGFGLLWTAFAGAMFPPMALFGLLFVCAGIWTSISAYHKAEQYETLRAEHDRKRSELLARLRSQ